VLVVPVKARLPLRITAQHAATDTCGEPVHHGLEISILPSNRRFPAGFSFFLAREIYDTLRDKNVVLPQEGFRGYRFVSP